jgi:hypothetical protein
MADETRLRASRSDPFQSSGAAFERGGAPSGADPLAELARLIGQDDLFKQMRKDAALAGVEPAEHVRAPSSEDWMERAQGPLRQLAASGRPSHEAEAQAWDDQHRYATTGRAAQYQPEPEQPAYYQEGYAPAGQPAAQEASYDQGAYGQQYYADDPAGGYREWEPDDSEYYDENATAEGAAREKRRGGLMIVASVVGVALIGTAGAFAYRAMSGGTGEGGQPPVIRADQGPAKVTPPQSTASTGARTTYDRAGGGGKDVNLVSREEQPVEIKDAKTGGPKLIAPTGAGPGLAGNPAQPPATLGATSSVPATGANPNEPKKVRTIAIRPDGTVAPEAAGTRTQPNAGTANRPVAPAQPVRPPARPGTPGPQGEADESMRPPGSVPIRTASIPSSTNPLPVSAPASAPAAPPPAANTSTGGNFVVQLASQKSENDAQASFRALQAKYPSVLAGRQPIIRRADLGDRGTYFRTQVGPFATADLANDLCGNLKAAGGQCIVQKN